MNHNIKRQRAEIIEGLFELEREYHNIIREDEISLKETIQYFRDETKKQREISEALWKLLDDIDTGTDMFKPDNKSSFVQYCYKKIAERFNYFKSDGHNLFTLEEYDEYDKSNTCQSDDNFDKTYEK